MVSLVLTIIAFAGAMGVPVFLTAIVESAFKVRPLSSRIRASRWTNWTNSYRPVANRDTSTKQTSDGQPLTDRWSVGRAVPYGPKAISNWRRKKARAIWLRQCTRHGTTRPQFAEQAPSSALGG